jgi:hypothetical protein
MKSNKVLYLFFMGLLATASLTMYSCKDKEETFPVPTVTLSATTFSGKMGQTASVTASVSAPGGLKSLTITKYKGTDVDASFGTNGSETLTDLTHTHTYVLSEEGLTTPIRFKFTAEDEKGQTGTADYIITTEPSVSYLLTKYNWQWKSKLGKCLASDPETEQILDCEKDNFFSFNADGTYQLNFGAITGTGGGTCDFDGFAVPTTWSLNTEETELTIKTSNAFDPTSITTEVYKITSATNASIKSKQTIDLSVFGCVVYDWGFEWTAKPK